MKTLVSLILSLSCLLLCGCATTTGKTLATVAVSVDAAMKGWATYASTHDISAEEHGTVRSAYEKYQVAMRVALSAYVAAEKLKDQSLAKQAAAAVAAARDDLIALVKLFTHNEVTL